MLSEASWTISRKVAGISAAILFVFGLKLLLFGYASRWIMAAEPDVQSRQPSGGVYLPSRGGPAVYPPPGFTPPPLSDTTPKFGLYPFVGDVPMESVGAGLVVLGVCTEAFALAWLGIIVLVAFSAGHTIVDWALIAIVTVSLALTPRWPWKQHA